MPAHRRPPSTRPHPTPRHLPPHAPTPYGACTLLERTAREGDEGGRRKTGRRTAHRRRAKGGKDDGARRRAATDNDADHGGNTAGRPSGSADGAGGRRWTRTRSAPAARRPDARGGVSMPARPPHVGRHGRQAGRRPRPGQGRPGPARHRVRGGVERAQRRRRRTRRTGWASDGPARSRSPGAGSPLRQRGRGRRCAGRDDRPGRGWGAWACTGQGGGARRRRCEPLRLQRTAKTAAAGDERRPVIAVRRCIAAPPQRAVHRRL